MKKKSKKKGWETPKILTHSFTNTKKTKFVHMGLDCDPWCGPFTQPTICPAG